MMASAGGDPLVSWRDEGGNWVSVGSPIASMPFGAPRTLGQESQLGMTTMSVGTGRSSAAWIVIIG